MIINKFGLTSNESDIIKKALYSFPEINKVVVFGSRALGNYKTGSDIDFAIFGKETISKDTKCPLGINANNMINSEILGKISTSLNEETPLPYFFDIIDYNKIDNKQLRSHIDNKGVIFYEQR